MAPRKKSPTVAEPAHTPTATAGYAKGGYIRTIHTNLALAEGRPEMLTLGERVTVLYGDNGAGKSRWIYALGLVINGAVDDYQGRSEPLKATKDLAWLLPRTAEAQADSLYVTADAVLPRADESGVVEMVPTTLGYRANVGGGTAGVAERNIPPELQMEGADWYEYIAPIRTVTSLLTGDVSKVRAKLMPLIANVRGEKLLELVPATYRKLPDGTQLPLNTTGDLVVGLDTIQVRAKAFKDTLQNLRKQIDEYAQQHGDTPPTQEELALAEAAYNHALDQLGQSNIVEEIHQGRADGVAVKEHAKLAQEKLDALQAELAALGTFDVPAPQPTNPKVVQQLEVLREAKALREKIIQLGLPFCPVTGRAWELGDLSRMEKAMEKAEGLLSGYRVAVSQYNSERAAHTNRLSQHQQAVHLQSGRVTQLNAKLKYLRDNLMRLREQYPEAWQRALAQVGKEAETGNGLETVDVPDSKRVVEEAEQHLSTLREARKQLDAHNERREKLAEMEEQEGWYTRAVAQWKKAIKTAISSGTAEFCALASKYLPTGHRLVIVLEDDNRQTFRLGLTRPSRQNSAETITTYALSGIQLTLAVFALSCAILERLPGGRPPLSILWPHQERSWAAGSLTEFLRAVTQIPNCPQIILPSTVLPLEQIEGVVVVNVADGLPIIPGKTFDAVLHAKNFDAILQGAQDAQGQGDSGAMGDAESRDEVGDPLFGDLSEGESESEVPARPELDLILREFLDDDEGL